MALIKIDGLGQADGEVFKPIPAGMYTLRITNVEDKVTGAKSKNPGSPMLSVKTQVTSVNEVGEGKVIFLNMVLPNANMDLDQKTMAVNRVKRLLLACGITQALDEFDTADLMGLEFKGVVTVEDGKNNLTDQLPIL